MSKGLPTAVKIRNAIGTTLNPATEEKQDDIIQQVKGVLSGAATDGTEQLTAANTWVEVPGTIPSEDYVLVVSKENEAGTIRWSFDDDGTPSATNGLQMTSNEIIFQLAAGQAVYFGSTDAGDDVTWTTKII